MKVVVCVSVTDGDEKHLGNGKYRHQIEFACSVECDVQPGDPGVYRDKNGDGYPPTGPSVDVQKVIVTGCTIYARNDFDTGVEIDSRDENYAEFLKSHAAWCKERIECDIAEENRSGIRDVHGVYEMAIEAADEEWRERREAC